MSSSTRVAIAAAMLCLIGPQAWAASLNDTGQATCFNLTAATGAPPEESGFEGQDCTRGAAAADASGVQIKLGGSSVAGRDYTKIANDGSELPDAASFGTAPGDWGCTRDNITGLTWELRPADGSFRDRSHRFSWQDTANGEGDTCGGTLGADCSTDAYLAAANTATVCGASDWQLPTPAQLEGLIAYDDPASTDNLVDRTWFPDQANDGVNQHVFWSNAQSDPADTAAWVADFSLGWTTTLSQDSAAFVRLVRGSPPTPGTRFTVSEPEPGERVVSDALTGLEWKQCPEGLSGTSCADGSLATLDWPAALAAAASASAASFAGHGDWRLPNIIELASIRDYAPADFSLAPAMAPAFAGTTAVENYWSSTNDPFPSSAMTALAYRYAGGGFAHGSLFKTQSLAVRLVRGGNFLGSHAPGLDTQPAPFTIPDGAAPAGSLAESQPVAVSGLTGPASLTVSGAAQSAWSLDGVNWSSLVGAVRNGDSIRVRHQAAASFGATAVSTLTIGGVSATFTSTAQDARTPQSITFGTNPGPLAVGTAGATVSATASSGLDVRFGTTTPSTCSVGEGDGALGLLSSGDCIVTADQDGDQNFLPAPRVTQTVVVTKAAQAIRFDAPAEAELSATPLSIAASGGRSGNPLVVASGSTAVCTAGAWQDGAVSVALLAIGTCTLTANQAGSAAYEAAPEATRVIRVVPPADPPGAPKNLVITARVEGVTLEFDPPDDDGGAPILHYAYVGSGVTGLPGEAQGRCEASPCEVTGLPAATIMYFEVRAVNRAGPGPMVFETSPQVLGANGTYPGAPLELRATYFSGRSIGLAWEPLEAAGGESIAYLIQYAEPPDETYKDVGVTSDAFASVTGLDSLTSYAFRVIGIDSGGNPGTPSAPVFASTTGTAPDIYFTKDQPTQFPEDFRGNPGHTLEAVPNGGDVTTVLFRAVHRASKQSRKWFIGPGTFDGTVNLIESPTLGKLFPNQSGEVHLRYRAINTFGRGSPAWVSIWLVGVNDPPLVSAGSVTRTSPGGSTKAAVQVQVPGFITSNHPGAANEQSEEGQGVASYVVEADPDNALPSPVSAVSVDASGTLRFTLDTANPAAAGYRHGFYLMARDDGDDRYDDGSCSRSRLYGPYDQRACSPAQKFVIVVGEWSGVNLSGYRDTSIDLEEELVAQAKIALDDPDLTGEDVLDPGEPPFVRYRFDVANLGAVPVSGATLRLASIDGLRDVSWTCTTPVGACSPASGTGAVSTQFDLGGASPDDVAVVTLTGKPVDGKAFVKIVAESAMPAGEPAQTPVDRTVLIDAASPEAVFLGGFE